MSKALFLLAAVATALLFGSAAALQCGLSADIIASADSWTQWINTLGSAERPTEPLATDYVLPQAALWHSKIGYRTNLYKTYDFIGTTVAERIAAADRMVRRKRDGGDEEAAAEAVGAAAAAVAAAAAAAPAAAVKRGTPHPPPTLADRADLYKAVAAYSVYRGLTQSAAQDWGCHTGKWEAPESDAELKDVTAQLADIDIAVPQLPSAALDLTLAKGSVQLFGRVAVIGRAKVMIPTKLVANAVEVDAFAEIINQGLVVSDKIWLDPVSKWYNALGWVAARELKLLANANVPDARPALDGRWSLVTFATAASDARYVDLINADVALRPQLTDAMKAAAVLEEYPTEHEGRLVFYSKARNRHYAAFALGRFVQWCGAAPAEDEPCVDWFYAAGSGAFELALYAGRARLRDAVEWVAATPHEPFARIESFAAAIDAHELELAGADGMVAANYARKRDALAAAVRPAYRPLGAMAEAAKVNVAANIEVLANARLGVNGLFGDVDWNGVVKVSRYGAQIAIRNSMVKAGSGAIELYALPALQHNASDANLTSVAEALVEQRRRPVATVAANRAGVADAAQLLQALPVNADGVPVLTLHDSVVLKDIAIKDATGHRYVKVEASGTVYVNKLKIGAAVNNDVPCLLECDTGEECCVDSSTSPFYLFCVAEGKCKQVEQPSVLFDVAEGSRLHIDHLVLGEGVALPAINRATAVTISELNVTIAELDMNKVSKDWGVIFGGWNIRHLNILAPAAGATNDAIVIKNAYMALNSLQYEGAKELILKRSIVNVMPSAVVAARDAAAAEALVATAAEGWAAALLKLAAPSAEAVKEAGAALAEQRDVLQVGGANVEDVVKLLEASALILNGVPEGAAADVAYAPVLANTRTVKVEAGVLVLNNVNTQNRASGHNGPGCQCVKRKHHCSEFIMQYQVLDGEKCDDACRRVCSEGPYVKPTVAGGGSGGGVELGDGLDAANLAITLEMHFGKEQPSEALSLVAHAAGEVPFGLIAKNARISTLGVGAERTRTLAIGKVEVAEIGSAGERYVPTCGDAKNSKCNGIGQCGRADESCYTWPAKVASIDDAVEACCILDADFSDELPTRQAGGYADYELQCGDNAPCPGGVCPHSNQICYHFPDSLEEGESYVETCCVQGGQGLAGDPYESKCGDLDPCGADLSCPYTNQICYHYPSHSPSGTYTETCCVNGGTFFNGGLVGTADGETLNTGMAGGSGDDGGIKASTGPGCKCKTWVHGCAYFVKEFEVRDGESCDDACIRVCRGKKLEKPAILGGGTVEEGESGFDPRDLLEVAALDGAELALPALLTGESLKARVFAVGAARVELDAAVPYDDNAFRASGGGAGCQCSPYWHGCGKRVAEWEVADGESCRDACKRVCRERGDGDKIEPPPPLGGGSGGDGGSGDPASEQGSLLGGYVIDAAKKLELGLSVAAAVAQGTPLLAPGGIRANRVQVELQLADAAVADAFFPNINLAPPLRTHRDTDSAKAAEEALAQRKPLGGTAITAADLNKASGVPAELMSAMSRRKRAGEEEAEAEEEEEEGELTLVAVDVNGTESADYVLVRNADGTYSIDTTDDLLARAKAGDEAVAAAANRDDGLSDTEVALIVVLCVLGAALLGTCAYVFVLRRNGGGGGGGGGGGEKHRVRMESFKMSSPRGFKHVKSSNGGRGGEAPPLPDSSVTA